MIRLAWVAALALRGAAGGFGVAHELDVTVVVHPPSREEQLIPERGHDCFGDGTVRMALDVFGTPGSSIDLVGELFQLTAALAVPIGAPLNIVVAKLFDNTARFRVSAPVRLPAVKRPSRFDFRIRRRSVAKTAWRLVGHQVFEVYPHGLLNDLADIGNTRVFILNDRDARLTSFLDGEGIPHRALDREALSELPPDRFADRPASAHMHAKARLVLRVLSSETDTRRVGTDDPVLNDLLRKGFRVIQFREKVATVPAVFVRQVGDGVSVDVEMPLIGALADSPRAQLFLLDLIRLALDDPQP